MFEQQEREAGLMTTSRCEAWKQKGVGVVEGDGKDRRQGVVERRPR